MSARGGSSRRKTPISQTSSSGSYRMISVFALPIRMASIQAWNAGSSSVASTNFHGVEHGVGSTVRDPGVEGEREAP